MKAEHRHELKTNDLAIWISNFPKWVNENLRVIVYTAVVIILILASAIYYYYEKNIVSDREQGNLTGVVSQLPQQKMFIARKQLENQDNAYMLFQFTDELDNIAKNATSDAVAATAMIKSAEVLRTELHYRLGTISQQDIETQIGKAKDLYNKALNKLKEHPNATLEGVAKVGLGLCEEELGNNDAARKIYEEVATGTTYENTPPAATAKKRLEIMDTYSTKIVLKPMPKQAIKAMPQATGEPNTPVQN